MQGRNDPSGSYEAIEDMLRMCSGSQDMWEIVEQFGHTFTKKHVVSALYQLGLCRQYEKGSTATGPTSALVDRLVLFPPREFTADEASRVLWALAMLDEVRNHTTAHHFVIQLGEEGANRCHEFTPPQMASFVNSLSRLARGHDEDELVGKITTKFSDYALGSTGAVPRFAPEDLAMWKNFLQEASSPYAANQQAPPYPGAPAARGIGRGAGRGPGAGPAPGPGGPPGCGKGMTGPGNQGFLGVGRPQPGALGPGGCNMGPGAGSGGCPQGGFPPAAPGDIYGGPGLLSSQAQGQQGGPAGGKAGWPLTGYGQQASACSGFGGKGMPGCGGTEGGCRGGLGALLPSGCQGCGAGPGSGGYGGGSGPCGQRKACSGKGRAPPGASSSLILGGPSGPGGPGGRGKGGSVGGFGGP